MLVKIVHLGPKKKNFSLFFVCFYFFFGHTVSSHYMYLFPAGTLSLSSHVLKKRYPMNHAWAQKQKKTTERRFCFIITELFELSFFSPLRVLQKQENRGSRSVETKKKVARAGH